MPIIYILCTLYFNNDIHYTMSKVIFVAIGKFKMIAKRILLK